MIIDYSEIQKLYTTLHKTEYTCVLYKIKQYMMYEVLNGSTYCERLTKRLLDAGETLLGKDEYVALLHNDECIMLIHAQDKSRIIKTIFFIDDQLQPSLSFGVHMISMDMDLFDVMLRCTHARQMDRDLNKHTTSFAFSSQEDFQKSRNDYIIQTTMEQALQNGEFTLFIQPKVTLSNRQISGGEALVRWLHKGYEIPLREFMPIIDQNAFIRNIDLYIFENVCERIATCIHTAKPVAAISVNVSRPSFEDGHHYIHSIQQILQRYPDVSPYLELELSEHILYEKNNLEIFVRSLKQLHIRVSLDDFGNGCIGLSRLASIPFDTIKLDQSFFQNPLNPRQASLIRAIVHMLKDLEFHIVAEGVETQEYEALLQSLNVDEIQGFYYYRAMIYDTFEELFAKK